MGVPTSEVGYTSAMPRREDHEVQKRTCGGIGGKKRNIKLKHVTSYNQATKYTTKNHNFTLTLPPPRLQNGATNVVINITVASS